VIRIKPFVWVISLIWAGWATYVFALGVTAAWTCFLPGHFWEWWFWKEVLEATLMPGVRLPPGY
jgi:hypothetical protein